MRLDNVYIFLYCLIIILLPSLSYDVVAMHIPLSELPSSAATSKELEISSNSIVHLLAVDVETAGSQLCWPCISVQLCHATYNFETKKLDQIETKLFSMRVATHEIEPKCYIEYWQKNLQKFFRLQRNATSYHEAAQQIALYVERILQAHPDITIISDNSTFDIARLNAILESQHRQPVAYRPDKSYQTPIDLGTLARAVALLENTEDTWLSRDIVSEKLLVPLPQDAIDSAYGICWKYIMYMEKIDRHRRVTEPLHMLGVDIKAAGSQLCWPVVSVGFCHAIYDFAVRKLNCVDLQRFDIQVDLSQFEPKCYDELWQHRLEVFNIMQKAAVPYEEAAQRIADHVQRLLQAHPSIVILSDNVAFDIVRLNGILESVGKEPISYRPDNIYQVPVDVTELARTVAALRNSQNPWVARDVDNSLLSAPHTPCPIKNDQHLPEHRAAEICWKYAGYVEELQKYKKV